MIDRRNLPLEKPKDLDPIVMDRFKYDNSQDDFPFYFPVESNSTAYVSLAISIEGKTMSDCL